jgi:hypothetical protein
VEKKLKNMSAYIFMCNWETYADCVEKNLFGVSQPYVNDIAPGDLCYLYQYDMKFLFGVWEATSTEGWHDPAAWNGRFKRQVRVRLRSEKIIQIPFSHARHLLDNSGTIIFKLGNDKAQELLSCFK